MQLGYWDFLIAHASIHYLLIIQRNDNDVSER